MKTHDLKLGAVLFLSVYTFLSCKSDEKVETWTATGTIIGSYSNGFGSLLLHVDEDYPIGKILECDRAGNPDSHGVNGTGLTMPEAGTYNNMIQVQAHMDKTFYEIADKNLYFTYREYNEEKDRELFTIDSGVAFWLYANPDVPKYVITSYKIL
ncbi:MAG: hypothetical protein LIO85_07040 [Rikenellaceae bacterium]|nr:hypothetical protein [Rikenellaceae bacterium]